MAGGGAFPPFRVNRTPSAVRVGVLSEFLVTIVANEGWGVRWGVKGAVVWSPPPVHTHCVVDGAPCKPWAVCEHNISIHLQARRSSLLRVHRWLTGFVHTLACVGQRLRYYAIIIIGGDVTGGGDQALQQ